MEKKFTVEFYERDNGEKPCLEFLNTLEVKLRAKAFRDLKLLEDKGSELGFLTLNILTMEFLSYGLSRGQT